MRTEKELYQSVMDAIKTVLDTDANAITPDAKLVADLGAESIDFLDISCELEKSIDYEVDFKEIMPTKRLQGAVAAPNDFTVREIVEYLSKQKI